MITRFSRVSHRVLSLDLQMHGYKYKIISIYMPHAGYPTESFNECLDDIRVAVLDGQRHGMRCLLGGDFNTELYRGWRGDRLQELLHEMDLYACNDPSLSAAQSSWTFLSVLGARRTLDYCFASYGISTRSAEAVSSLDLGSDHRTVQSCLMLPSAPQVRRKHPRGRRRIDWEKFRQQTTVFDAHSVHEMGHLEAGLADIAAESCKSEDASKPRPWDTDELRDLRQRRRSTADVVLRRMLSKQIWRDTRAQLRKWRTEQAQAKLLEFTRLKGLQQTHMYPVLRNAPMKPDFAKCAELLRTVYETEHVQTEKVYHGQGIAPFSFTEVRQALSKMAKGRCADKGGVVLEMFLHSDAAVTCCLVQLLNRILQTGEIPQAWYETHFSLLHKGGNTEDPNNWRPIAILSITYKILARLIYVRIRSRLENLQSEDQFGFRSSRSTTHALLVMESMISKSLEWSMPLWIVSIDLRKAFDRIEHRALMAALQAQGLSSEYISLLELLYRHQIGVVDDYRFPIRRGVRQGDVLSPLLFNAALEHALAQWKSQLSGEGFALTSRDGEERLTNIRYADDILLFAQSRAEAVSMLESMAEVLSSYGLEMNVAKTKILSSELISDAPLTVSTRFGDVTVLAGVERHKYLGRGLVGDLRGRGRAAVEHRIGCAWMKYRALQHVFEDRHVSVALRLKLFDSVVGSTAVYSLETCPLTLVLERRLDTVQRTMLRRMVGWICCSEDSWEDRGRRMKRRLERAMALHPVQPWSLNVQEAKQKLKDQKLHLPKWCRLALEWEPLACANLNRTKPYRRVGRPMTRWSD